VRRLGTLRYFRLVVAYDGTGYRGWQVQPGAPTVQGVLTGAARGLLGEETTVTGASRTDAGVHALRQTVSLVTRRALAAEAVRAALNAALPADIRVLEARAVDTPFNARRDAGGKRYAYLIDNGPVANPLWRRYAWHVAAPLDVGAMRRALAPLRGRHDFSAFRAALGRDQAPVCAVRALHVLRRRHRVAVLVSADRYLHHMVRTIVGSAVAVGRGARPAAWLADALCSRDRARAGPTAPPQGLVLVRVVDRPARVPDPRLLESEPRP
jgi:tRNA pseudouridine38-40 synthase